MIREGLVREFCSVPVPLNAVMLRECPIASGESWAFRFIWVAVQFKQDPWYDL